MTKDGGPFSGVFGTFGRASINLSVKIPEPWVSHHVLFPYPRVPVRGTGYLRNRVPRLGSVPSGFTPGDLAYRILSTRRTVLVSSQNTSVYEENVSLFF